MTALTVLAVPMANAQFFDDSGSGAVDWTMTDWTGETTLTLSEEQDAGKIVLYDYFFTTCFYCTVSAPELEDIYVEHGPLGSNTLEIISLDVDAGTHAVKPLDEYITEFGVSNPIFDLDTDYAGENYAWFYAPYADPDAGPSYGLPHFIAVCPDGSWKSLFQTEIFPGSGASVNTALREFLNSSCPGVFLDVISLDEKELLTVSPNPTSDILNIKFTSEELLDVSVMNMVGEVVFSSQMTYNLEINVSDFPKGIYVVNVTGENGMKQEKFIVQ